VGYRGRTDQRASMDTGDGASLELVDVFCYLGDILSVDGDADAAVEARIFREGISLDNSCLCLSIRTSHFL